MNTTGEPPPLLKVTKLSVSVRAESGIRELVHEASFTVREREILIILGESGSGKTLLSRSLTKLFPVSSPMKVRGSVALEGQQLLELGEPELARIRRRRIRYVFQEPMQSLNPLATIGKQMRLAHDSPSRADGVLHETLLLAGLDNSEEVLSLYPHELSIGMAQRVCIAMAMLPSPALLIADEPTSAVDASLRRHILELLSSLQHSGTMSLLLITHDLNAARSYGDRVIVMFGGRIIESATCKAFFEQPLHPYSRLLVDAQPINPQEKPPVLPITESGFVGLPQRGCSFEPRCLIAKDTCKEVEPELNLVPGGREVRCPYWK